MPRRMPEVIGPIGCSPLGTALAPSSLIRSKIFSASASIRSVSASTYHEPPSGSATLADAGLLHQHLLGAQRDLGGLLAGQRQRLVQGVGVQRVGAAEHRGQRLHGGAHHVVVRLLRGERDAGGLGVEAQPLRLVGGRAVDVPHPAGPDPAGGAELGDLLEEVQVRVEEEGQAGREGVHVQAAGQAQLHVAEAVGEGVRQLLRGRRAGLADVVAGDRQRLVRRDVGGAVLHQVADQPQVRARARRATPSARCTP